MSYLKAKSVSCVSWNLGIHSCCALHPFLFMVLDTRSDSCIESTELDGREGKRMGKNALEIVPWKFVNDSSMFFTDRGIYST